MAGIVLAMFVAGLLTDKGIIWMSRRNRGVYEPEYRLVFLLGMLIGVFGYVGWAVGNDHGMPWIGAVSCLAYVPLFLTSPPQVFVASFSHFSFTPARRMLYFSLVISNGTSIAYLIDAHGSRSVHVMALIDCTKGVISYGATFFTNGVVLSRGIKVSLLILCACQAACWLVSVPMYVYGKRVRSFVSISTPRVNTYD